MLTIISLPTARSHSKQTQYIRKKLNYERKCYFIFNYQNIIVNSRHFCEHF